MTFGEGDGVELHRTLKAVTRSMNLLLKALVSHGRLWTGIEEMLSKDIPVIFAIGPNFPLIWQKHRLSLYKQSEGGGYVKTGSVQAHFVSVTGMDERWLRISSWGEMYYIERREYMRFCKEHSCKLMCNYLYIREK